MPLRAAGVLSLLYVVPGNKTVESRVSGYVADARERKVSAGDEIKPIRGFCQRRRTGSCRGFPVDVEGDKDVRLIELDIVTMDHVAPEDQPLTVPRLEDD